MTLLLSFSCAYQAGTQDEHPELITPTWAFERLEPQVYTPEGWPQTLEATVYRPEASGPLPAVLVVHGGGWARRTPADMERICRMLASRGLVAVNVAYRLAPTYLYPAPVKDLQLALDWMVGNASALQIDPTRLGAFGYSAGAHLVSLLAVLESGDDPQWNPAQRGSRLQAVVAGGTPADLTKWPDSPLVNQFLGEAIKTSRATWVEASPISHVTPSSPPFFLYHGGFDQLVEVEQAHAMKARLDEAGVRAELYTVPYHGHLSMFLLNRSAVERGAAFLAHALK